MKEILPRFTSSAPDAPRLDASSPPHAAIARVWLLGDRYVLRARSLGPATLDAFDRETALLDRARPLLPYAAPDPLAADDGLRCVVADGSLWTLHRALPGRAGTPWQELHRAPDDERRRLVEALKALHDATLGRLGPGDPGWIVRDVRARLEDVRGLLSSDTAARLDAAMARVEEAAGRLEPGGLVFVHGDFHWGNLLADDLGRVTGMVDLDWCRVASPLDDLAYTAMMLVRDYDGGVARLADVDRILAWYGLERGEVGPFLDRFLLYALFDVHLFRHADGLPDRERYVRFQVTMLEELCRRLGPAGHGRPPAVVRRDGNRLKDERSLYLRQHAHNPVDWMPWGPEALARAKAEVRPVFLSIGYASCHWCHVMEHESFEDDEVAAVLNPHFVCIKVDREERPDLDAVFLEAVQAMTGSGGWPATLFLTPDLKPFHGGTYFPKDALIQVAKAVAVAWARERDAVENQAREVAAAVAAGPDAGAAGGVAAAAADEASREVLSRLDVEWGGIIGRMKFPMVPLWDRVLHLYRRTGDERAETALSLTLDRMATGGIRDQVGGGFHRYATDHTWTVPHFEKMLYDNAQLARLYAEASLAADDPEWAEVATDTLDFLLREMSDGVSFFASLDADSGGREGSFYLWDLAEFAEVAGPRDGAVLARMLGAGPEGNFEGWTIPTRRPPAREVAAWTGVAEDEVDAVWRRWRPSLREHRARRDPPGLDRKVVTAWNGMAVRALAWGSRLAGGELFLAAAGAVADFLLAAHARPDGGLCRATNGGVPAGEGTLEDYAQLALGLLDLHAATGDLARARQAVSVVDTANARFRREEGAWYLTSESVEAPLGRRVDVLDNATPSGASAMTIAVLRCAALTGRPDLVAEADRALDAWSGLAVRAWIEMPWWLDAVVMREDCRSVVIAGDTDDARTAALVAAVRDLHAPHVTSIAVPASGPDAGVAAAFPVTSGKTALGGRPTAYVCDLSRCLAPVHEPDELRKLASADWKTL
jgi:uncharacterized protein YyaL (SSP411 family)/aminoglycoside phosphotransferase (APT) family kinase protein